MEFFVMADATMVWVSSSALDYGVEGGAPELKGQPPSRRHTANLVRAPSIE